MTTSERIADGLLQLIATHRAVWFVFQLTVLLASAWLMHAVLGRLNPRWRVLLWRGVALGVLSLPGLLAWGPRVEWKLLQPRDSAPAPAAVVSEAEAPPESFVSTVPPGAENWGAPETAAKPQAADVARAHSDRSEDVAAHTTVDAPLESHAADRWPMAFAGLWLAGFLLFAVRIVVGHWRISALVSRASAPPEQILEIFARVAGGLSCRRPVTLLCSAEARTPFLCGLRRSILVCPESFLDANRADDLPAIFAHELSHVESRDVIWNTLLHLEAAALWFHPLAWKAPVVHAAACEAVGDAVSAQYVGDAAVYSRVLARVVLEILSPSRSPRPASAAALAMARTAEITRRLDALERGVFHSPLARRTVMFVAAPSLGAFLLSASVGLGYAEPKESASGTAAGADASQPKQIDTGKTEANRQKDTKDAAKPKKAAPTPPAAGSLRKSILSALGLKPQRATSTPAAGAANDAGKPKSAVTKGSMRVRVVGPDGKPLAGAKIHASVWPNPAMNRQYKCDAKGETVVELPKELQILRVWAGKAGHVSLFAQWWPEQQTDGHLIPDEFTFRLEKGSVIGGRIVNEKGQPIAGVKVEVQYETDEGLLRIKPEDNSRRPIHNSWLATGSDESISDPAQVTGANGRWKLENVPPGEDVKVRLLLSHPDYVSDREWRDLELEDATQVTMKLLRAQTSAIQMRRGTSFVGTVNDPNGKPISGAIAVWGDDPYREWGSQEVRTNDKGVFRLPPMDAGPVNVTVIAEGWAPMLTTVNLPKVDSTSDRKDNSFVMAFALERGKTIRLRFVDETGAPIPGVSVSIDEWRGSKSLYNHKHPDVVLDTKIPRKADEMGIYEWTWAPNDSVRYNFSKGSVRYDLSKEGYKPRLSESLVAEEGVQEIRLTKVGAKSP